jgi:hypothetical protein
MALLPATSGLALDAWSGDGRRALVSSPTGAGRGVTEVDLESGRAIHELSVSRDASLRYSTPNGLAILVEEKGIVSWVDIDRSGLDPSVCLTSMAIRIAGVAMPDDAVSEDEASASPAERAVRLSIARCLAIVSGTGSHSGTSPGIPEGELSVCSFAVTDGS